MPVHAAVITFGCSSVPEVISAGGRGASRVPGFQVTFAIVLSFLPIGGSSAEYSRKFAKVKRENGAGRKMYCIVF